MNANCAKHPDRAFRTLAGDDLVAFRRRDAIEAGLAKPQTDSSGSHKKVPSYSGDPYSEGENER